MGAEWVISKPRFSNGLTSTNTREIKGLFDDLENILKFETLLEVGRHLYFKQKVTCCNESVH